MTDTPIADFLEEFLSGGNSGGNQSGLPVEMVVAAVRAFEARLSKSTSPSARDMKTLNRQREWDRNRKRAARVLSGGRPVDTKIPSILTTTSSLSDSLKEKTESKSLTPARKKREPGSLVPVDDWPSDYEAQFWDAYPPGRKHERKAVMAKLAKIRRDREVTFEKLMAGVGRFVASKPDPQFTKAPLVWLNKGCWDDEHAIPGRGSAARAPVQRQESFRDILMGGSHDGR